MGLSSGVDVKHLWNSVSDLPVLGDGVSSKYRGRIAEYES